VQNLNFIKERSFQEKQRKGYGMIAAAADETVWCK